MGHGVTSVFNILKKNLVVGAYLEIMNNIFCLVFILVIILLLKNSLSFVMSGFLNK